MSKPILAGCVVTGAAFAAAAFGANAGAEKRTLEARVADLEARIEVLEKRAAPHPVAMPGWPIEVTPDLPPGAVAPTPGGGGFYFKADGLTPAAFESGGPADRGETGTAD